MGYKTPATPIRIAAVTLIGAYANVASGKRLELGVARSPVA
jgi:hypothetical protein